MNYKNLFYQLYQDFKLERQEVIAEIEFIIEIVTGLTNKDFVLGATLDEAKCLTITKIIQERVSSGRPIQQIVGEAFFAGEKFFVSESTLIPRPETELIVQECVKNFNALSPLNILDIGTGSGCIAITLAKHFVNAKVVGIDISRSALNIAKKNARRHLVSDRVQLCLSDVFENVLGTFDIIVSNPPYISIRDIAEVQEDVVKFEPKIALFAEDDGLYFYKKIIQSCSGYCHDKTMLVFELGVRQSEAVGKLLQKNNFVNITLTKDLDGINRVISGTYRY